MGRILVIGCGALAEELSALKKANQWTALDIKCLDAALHNRPERIADRLESLLAQHHAEYTNILIAYADCGTGGAIDRVAHRFNAQRLPGAHCYEFYATSPVFAALAEAERAAARLKLPLEVVTTGYGLLASKVEEQVVRVIA